MGGPSRPPHILRAQGSLNGTVYALTVAGLTREEIIAGVDSAIREAQDDMKATSEGATDGG